MNLENSEIKRPQTIHSALATFMVCPSFDKCYSKGDLNYDKNKCERAGEIYVGGCRYISENCELAQP